MDHHFAHDVDETRITSSYSESRCQQLGREKCQLVGVDGLLESVISKKVQQAIESLLPKTSKIKDDLKDGIFCTLCYIVISNNALMEQHLIGPAHLRNVEAEMCRENNKLKGNLRFCNETVKATTSDVEVSFLGNKSRSREIDQTVIEDKNMKDVSLSVTIDTESVVMKNKDIKNEIAPAQSETAKEESNSGCGICEYFEGVENHIPEHYCLHGFKTPELPAGWNVKTSRTSGWTFYINIVTNESQWDFPSEPTVDELPKGWAVKRAKCNGLPFYINKVTNDWQWDHPTKSTHVKVSEDLCVKNVKETLSDVTASMTKARRMLSKLELMSGITKSEVQTAIEEKNVNIN